MVVLGRGAVSDERGTSVPLCSTHCQFLPRVSVFDALLLQPLRSSIAASALQEYLAHKKTPTPLEPP